MTAACHGLVILMVTRSRLPLKNRAVMDCGQFVTRPSCESSIHFVDSEIICLKGKVFTEAATSWRVIPVASLSALFLYSF